MRSAGGKLRGKQADKGLKESIEYGGSLVNQLNAIPFRLLGKTLHIMASLVVNNSISVVYTSMCSSGSVEPSYRSMDSPLHLGGNSTFTIPSTKGWCLSCKLEVSLI